MSSLPEAAKPATLRDMFAMAALQGSLSSEEVSGIHTVTTMKFLAKTAYAYADTMLKARKQ